MITRKLVTLILDIDTEKESHPRDWDWPTLLDIPSERVLRIEVFSVGVSSTEDKEQVNVGDNAKGLRARSSDEEAE